MPKPSLTYEQPLIVTAWEGGGVHVSLDLPPPPSLAPVPWPPSDAREYIEWEIRRLLARKPKGLLSLELCGAPRNAVDEDGKVYTPPIHGPPWQINATIQRPSGSPYETPRGIRIRMLLERDYPSSPPKIHLMQVVHHFCLDGENGLPDLFYESLTDLAESDAVIHSLPATKFSLRATLQVLAYVLEAPLHPCEGCESQFDAFVKMHKERLANIAKYIPMRRAFPFFEERWRREWIHPTLAAALSDGRPIGPQLEAAASRAAGEGGGELFRREAEGVWSFPMLSIECCNDLLAEIDSYSASGLPASRPNSMNQYGLILNEIGMEPLFDALVSSMLAPISRHLFPLEGGSLDKHHSFVVQYESGKDLGLDMHTDNSDVTFNVCLGREFDGAGLTFCGYMGEPHHRHFSYRYKHEVGRCVVHLGRRRHGADNITSGERVNLIVWCTNLAHRASKAYDNLQRQRVYAREAGPPEGVCLSYTHDRDFLEYRTPTEQNAKQVRRAWCPPLFARHDADPDEENPRENEEAELLELQRALRRKREEPRRRRLAQGGGGAGGEPERGGGALERAGGAQERAGGAQERAGGSPELAPELSLD